MDEDLSIRAGKFNGFDLDPHSLFGIHCRNLDAANAALARKKRHRPGSRRSDSRHAAARGRHFAARLARIRLSVDNTTTAWLHEQLFHEMLHVCAASLEVVISYARPRFVMSTATSHNGHNVPTSPISRPQWSMMPLSARAAATC
jgi:hypothetical protein